MTTAPPPPDTGRVLVLQHHPDEDPGALGPLLAAAGLTLTTVELDRSEPIPPLEDFDFMVVMGGPMDVWQQAEHPWLVEEKLAIRHWVAALGRPYLGVCLGHQLLADALGGAVGPMETPEIGVMDIVLTADGRADALFGGLAPVFPGLQWHGAEVTEPPPDAAVLAHNEYSAIQALRVGERAWGVQFHLEVDTTTVPTWAGVPEYASALERTCGSPAVLARAVEEELPAMAAAARDLVHEFVGSAVGLSPSPL